jgi:hypothetical protein
MRKELDIITIQRISKKEGKVLNPLLEEFITSRQYDHESINYNTRYIFNLIEEILIEIIEIKKEIDKRD